MAKQSGNILTPDSHDANIHPDPESANLSAGAQHKAPAPLLFTTKKPQPCAIHVQSKQHKKTTQAMKHLKKIAMYFCCFGSAIAQTSCDLIDDDLSDCGKDYKLEYRMRLITNMDDELAQKLREADDEPIKASLRQHLLQFFSDSGHDLDLSFYLTAPDDEARRHHALHDMLGANQASYTIYLPVSQYRNLAVANSGREPLVVLQQEQQRSLAELFQLRADTIDSHRTGLFTGRHTIDPPAADTTIVVDLYMANCAAALVCDTTGYRVSDFRVYMADMGDAFHVDDSVYTYTTNPVVRTRRVDAATKNSVAFAGATFPSADVPTRADADDGRGSYWQMRAYVTLADGKTTETVLYVRDPLKAAQLRIIKCRLTEGGVVTPTVDANVGISIQLDWEPGMDFNQDV